MGLYTERTTERIFLNGQDVTEICIGYTNSGVLIYIFLPEGRRLKTTQGSDYRTFVYGKLRIVKELKV